MMCPRSVGYGVLIFVSIACLCSVILISWLCSVSLGVRQTSPIVRISNGTLEGGFMTSRKGREFVAFRGIPYAQPPIGELRFEPPKPFGSWTGVRSARDDSNSCIQRDVAAAEDAFVGFEDCLYLNVYRPKLPSNDTDGCQKSYPVMIWIHGGGFVMGSASADLYGPQFILDHKVVLVTLNYRLGALGFLSTEDLVSPGNQGLKDQAQAIRWVHENIAAFNGDPKRVTIFGQSAGAASVHYHMISPHVRGLFHRAISQSGSALSPWALNRPGIAKNQSMKLGQLLDCPTDESSALVGCLKKKNAVDIIATACRDQVFDTCSIKPFRPVIEPDHQGAYIKEEPARSLKSGNVANVPWMTGINSQDGTYKVAGIYASKDQRYDKIFDENFIELAPKSLGYDDTCLEELKYNVTVRIREFYLGDKKIDESTKWDLIDMYTDAWFYIGSQIAVADHLETLTAPVYYYYFAYRGTSSYSTLSGDKENDYGVSHSDELQYLFPIGTLRFPNASMSKEDHKVADVMTRLWVNFAKSGNPTPKRTSLIPVKWRPVKTASIQYLHIGNSTAVHMAEDLFPERVNFWASIPYRSKIDLGSFSFSIAFGDEERDYGVVHADELQYLFPFGELVFVNTPLSEGDLKIVDLMTSLWVNFAKSGNPTPETTAGIPVKWKPARTSRLGWVTLHTNLEESAYG